MEPESHSAHSSYTYSNFALPAGYWENHKYKESIKTQILTISQTLKVDLKDHELTFKIQSLAGFNREAVFVSDSYNQGTLVDILNYSFKPLKCCQSIQTDDSLPATLVKTCEFMTSTQRGINLGGVFAHEPFSNANGMVMASTSHNCNTNTQEFEGKKFRKKRTNIVEFDMKLCYDGNDKLNGIPYSITDLTTLKCCYHGSRVAIGLTPYGWFGGWKSKPDIIYKVPDAAQSSFGADWSLRYEVTNFENLKFKWSTEVRTVFASNDYNAIKTNACGDFLNWIITIHKITHTIKINVNDEGIPSIEVINRNVKVLSATGFDDRRIYRDLLLDEYPDPSVNENWFDETHRDNQIRGLTPTGVDDARKKELKISIPDPFQR